MLPQTKLQAAWDTPIAESISASEARFTSNTLVFCPRYKKKNENRDKNGEDSVQGNGKDYALATL
jgi:hypothetical protein